MEAISKSIESMGCPANYFYSLVSQNIILAAIVNVALWLTLYSPACSSMISLPPGCLKQSK